MRWRQTLRHHCNRRETCDVILHAVSPDSRVRRETAKRNAFEKLPLCVAGRERLIVVLDAGNAQLIVTLHEMDLAAEPGEPITNGIAAQVLQVDRILSGLPCAVQ